MFKIESISFINGNDFQTYKFSSHTFVYGLNTVGKTALTKAIDYVLGSSDGLTYQGLDNIEGIEAYLTNGLTNLWIKRTISGNYYYKRTLESQYSEVSSVVSTKTPGCRAKEEIHGILDIARVSWIFIFL